MALTVIGPQGLSTLGQTVFLHVSGGYYIPLSKVESISDEQHDGNWRTRFLIDTIQYTVPHTLAETVNVLSAAGVTFIEGLT